MLNQPPKPHTHDADDTVRIAVWTLALIGLIWGIMWIIA